MECPRPVTTPSTIHSADLKLADQCPLDIQLSLAAAATSSSEFAHSERNESPRDNSYEPFQRLTSALNSPGRLEALLGAACFVQYTQLVAPLETVLGALFTESPELIPEPKKAFEFFEAALELSLKNEAEKFHSTNWQKLAADSVFLQSFCACVAIIFLQTSNKAKLKWVLELTQVHAVDLWRQLQTFWKLNTVIPSDLLAVLHQVEVQILFSLAWEDDSPLLSHACRTLPPHVVRVFYTRLFKLIRYRIRRVRTSLQLSEEQEALITSTLGYFLEEACEYLELQSVDDIILCTTFAVCRIYGMGSFTSLATRYNTLFRDEAVNSSSVLDFYNNTFILLVKMHLTTEVPSCQVHSLKNSAKKYQPQANGGPLGRLGQELKNGCSSEVRRVLSFNLNL